MMSRMVVGDDAFVRIWHAWCFGESVAFESWKEEWD